MGCKFCKPLQDEVHDRCWRAKQRAGSVRVSTNADDVLPVAAPRPSQRKETYVPLDSKTSPQVEIAEADWILELRQVEEQFDAKMIEIASAFMIFI